MDVYHGVQLQAINKRMTERSAQIRHVTLEIIWLTAAKYRLGELVVLGLVVGGVLAFMR